MTYKKMNHIDFLHFLKRAMAEPVEAKAVFAKH